MHSLKRYCGGWQQRLCLWLLVLAASVINGISAAAMTVTIPPIIPSAWQGDPTAGQLSSAFTLQKLVHITDQFNTDSVDKVTLATITSPISKQEIVALTWLKDTSDWWPMWNLGFIVNMGVPGQHTENAVVQPVKVTPIPGHTYRVTLSYDLASGLVAAEVVDTATNKAIYVQGLQIAPYSGDGVSSSNTNTNTYTSEDIAYYNDYLPISTSWQLEARFIERHDKLAVRIQSAGLPSGGSYRLLLHHNGGEKVLVRIESGADQHLLIPGEQLPLGKSSLILQYVKDGRILLSDQQDIAVGSAVLSYQPIQVSTDRETAHGSLQIRSRSNIANVHVRVEANLAKMIWDEEQRIYKSIPLGKQVAFDGVVDAAVDKVTQVPLKVDFQNDKGMFKVEFQEVIDADISLTRSGASRLFSTYPAADVPAGKPFTIAILGDTQNYTELYPDVFTRQTEWLAANAKTKNIVLALQVGDITNHNRQAEWENAQTSMSVVQGVVPYVLSVGNHDLLSNYWSPEKHSYTLISRFFPPETFPALQGTFEPGEVANSYYEFEFSGVKYLVMTLEFGPRDMVLEWANQVVTSHPNHKVIIVTHVYTAKLGDLVTEENSGDLDPHRAQPMAKDEGANDGLDIWEKLVRKHANIYMVFSGHICSKTIPMGTYIGDRGNKVYNFLVDTSDQPNGGDGWLALFDIYPDGTFTADYYSPYLGHSSEPSPPLLGGWIYR